MSDATPVSPIASSVASALSKGERFRPPTLEELNAVLPQYEFTALIGAGGMGAVYQARQPKLNRYVAIKILPPMPADELGFAERFRREAQSMAQLSHPHIVSVFDFGETAGGHLYFVMEYVEGADLHRLIAQGQLTLDHFYGWIPQVCDAIQYAHDHGIVHRDIKPANILIDREGRVKIADFGLAKLTDPDGQASALTQTDLSMGTPDYAAPEQIDGSSEVDWRSDIYSLGVVMYQMLTGKLPRGAFPMPSETNPGIDTRLDEVVLRAMQSEPAFRFQRASEIAHQITEIWSHPNRPQPAAADSQPAEKPLHHQPVKRSSLFPVAAGLVGVSILAGLLIHFVRQSLKPEKQKPGKAAPVQISQAKPSSAKNEGGNKPTKPPKPDSSAIEEGAKNKPPKGIGEKPPPRDFTRRSESGENDPRAGQMAAFRDKLGTRKPFNDRLDLMRRQKANVTVLGLETEGVANSPVAALPDDLLPVAQIAVGQGPPRWEGPPPFVLALQTNGVPRAWGSNVAGQCDIPQEAVKDIIQVAAGAAHGLALRRDGTVAAWGENGAGQCEVPAGLSQVTALAAGRNFSAALRADGTVMAWGAAPARETPANLTGVLTIAAGFDHLMALKGDGTVAVWGDNEFRQLDMPPLTGATAIAATFAGSFALLEDGSVKGWGAGAGKPGATDFEGIVEIRGSGDCLVLRNDEHRLQVHGSSPRHAAIGSTLRTLPREVHLAVTDKLVIAYRPAELKVGAPAAEAPAPPPPPVNPAPVIPPQAEPLSEAGQQIEDLRKKFEQAYLDRVTGPYEEALQQLNVFYLNHLEERQASAAKASQLDEAVAWRDEAGRVRTGEALPAADDPALPSALVDLRRTYRDNAAAYETTRATAELELLTQYKTALQTLQDRFTQEQKLDAALEVKAFREQL